MQIMWMGIAIPKVKGNWIFYLKISSSTFVEPKSNDPGMVLLAIVKFITLIYNLFSSFFYANKFKQQKTN